ncbi:hypothetical protein EON81_07110 [bacterium]|nr:MAG: hypothetical protein EON81_07110 [bacterium]
MIHTLDVTFQELRDDLEQRGIDVSKPGFYEAPKFQAAYGFDTYAEFVRQQPYTPEYLAYAKGEVEALTWFLHSRIRDFGRMGACIDASELMHRMLERRGVWCFTVKGGMTIHYRAAERHLPDGYYWPWSLNPELAAGHAWVWAPPYRIIDSTIRLEPYFDGEEELLPEFVLQENARPGEVEAVDIMMADEFWTLTGQELTLEAIDRRDPTLLPATARWGVRMCDYPECTVKYIPVAVSAPMYQLEAMEDNIECGTLPMDLMREYESERG